MRRAVLFLLLFGFVSQVQAQNLRDLEFMQKVQVGFTDIYNQDYEEAKKTFALLEAQYPYHPAPPLYTAIVLWLDEMLRRQDLDLSRFVSAAYFSRNTNQIMPAKERTDFFNHLNKSESLVKAILSKNKNDKDARYFQATIYGLKSSFAITIDHSLRQAFSSGDKANSECKQLIKEDPAFYDAYLTIGVYEYIVGSIPWYLKWAAYIVGAHGSKSDGFKHLAMAHQGQYSKNEAQLVEMVLFVREGKYSESLAVARSLAEQFPRSFLFPLNIAQTLQWAGQKDQAALEYVQLLKRVEAGEPNFHKLPLQKFRFHCATELMNLGKWDLAKEPFISTIKDPKSADREKALAHLRLGQILENSGQRDKAGQEYRAVLSLQNFDDSHEQAKRFLERGRPARN
jgi:tetratricopeptide (TPR) repeat protein